MNDHAPLRSKEPIRVAFEPVRVGLIAVGQPPVKHPSGVVRVGGSARCCVFCQ